MSKDNLLWKLDVLETQLAKDPTHSRLYRSKFAAEKKPKSSELPQRELETLIRDTKRQLVDRKIHHGVVQTQRALKSVINLELLKIKRRIKKVDGENEKSAKKSALEEELKAVLKLKELNISKYLVYRQLHKSYVTRDDPEADFITPEVLIQIKETKSNPEFGSDKSVMNVISRLCNSKGLKTVFDELVRSVDHVVTRERREKDEHYNAEEVNDNMDRERESRPKGEERKVNIDRENGNEDLSSSEDEFYDTYDSMVAGSDSEGEEEESKNEDINKKAESKKRKDVENQEEADNDSDDSDLGPDDFFSGNLPSLATGYVSGSDEEDNYDYDNDKVVKEAVSERKNRRGQRARRKIWEMKFGKGAKHLVKEREERYVKSQQKQQEFEEREARRQAKRGKYPDEMSSSAVEPAQKKFKSAVDPSAKPLHPSWEAKKKQKVSATNFQGKKVKFD